MWDIKMYLREKVFEKVELELEMGHDSVQWRDVVNEIVKLRIFSWNSGGSIKDRKFLGQLLLCRPPSALSPAGGRGWKQNNPVRFKYCSTNVTSGPDT